MDLVDYIDTIPDFPKPDIMFRDVTSLFASKAGFQLMLDELTAAIEPYEFDIIAGIDARGFIVGAALAGKLETSFVPLRKEGKLPGDVIRQPYSLEYGQAVLEARKDSFRRGDRVLLVDDLIATGGTAIAGTQLIERLGAKVCACVFIVDLPDLGGSNLLVEAGYSVVSLCSFDGD